MINSASQIHFVLFLNSMAATTLSLCFSSLDPQHHHLHLHRHHHYHLCSNTHFKSHQTLPFIPSPPIPKYPLPLFHKSDRYSFKSSSFPSSSPSSSSSSTTTSATAPVSSFLEEPRRTGRFLSNEEYDKLKLLEDFRYFQELASGSLWVRVMRAEEMDITVELLAESFVESMVLTSAYMSLLRFLVKQYLMERRAAMPHAVTLIGFYRKRKKESDNGEREEEEEEEERLAGTVEVCFDKRGANASPPTPTPPKNSPYICNMAVKEQLRRRGIGWHLLKASEELISQMSSSREVYLHCRMIDTAPFNMYTKAGYYVVKTDSVLILLMLQRRKHLMCKRLPVLSSPEESDMSGSEDE